jgi:hypothetical protein
MESKYNCLLILGVVYLHTFGFVPLMYSRIYKLWIMSHTYKLSIMSKGPIYYRAIACVNTTVYITHSYEK